MSETFDGLARKLLLSCPKLGPFIARDYIKRSFADVKEIYNWSWRLKRTQITVPTAYTTGTAETTYGSPTVTITTGVVDSAHIGRQFRVGTASPIMTITAIDAGANTYTLNDNWLDVTGTGQSYKVYQAYLSMPSDFQAFWSLVDPETYWPIQTDNVTLQMIDKRDPQRSVVGSPPRVIVPYDYYNGSPRYELWPHQTSQAYYLMAYEARYGEAFDAGVNIPDTLGDGDVLIERGLMYAARWPGPNRNDPNPYYSEKTAAFHKDNYDRRIGILIKEDVERMQNAVWYQEEQNWNQRNLNAAYMQNHDLTRW